MILERLAIALLVGAGVAALGQPLLAIPLGLVLGLSATWHAPLWRLLPLALLITGTAVGAALWLAPVQPSAAGSDVAQFIGKGPARVRGIVNSAREEQQHALLLRVRVRQVETDSGWHKATGTLLVRGPLSWPYEYGDLIEVRGPLTQPRQVGGFDYRAYLARQGVFAESIYPSVRLLAKDRGSRWTAWLVHLRERLANGIASVLPEPEASLGAGIALGTRHGLDPQLSADLLSTGTAQIVDATGYDVALTGLLVLASLTWLTGRRWASVLSLAAVAAYATFIGLTPSITRAAILGAIVVLATLSGRPHRGMRGLLLAGALMVAIDPLALNDLPFRASFCAVAGLFAFAEPVAGFLQAGLSRLTKIDPLPGVLASMTQALAITVIAFIASQPAFLLTFPSMSLAQLPANLVLMPLVPALMAMSVATAFAGAVWHPAALILAPVAYALLAFMVWVIKLCAELPGAKLSVHRFGLPEALVVYGLFSCAAVAMTERARAAEARLWSRLWQTPQRQAAGARIMESAQPKVFTPVDRTGEDAAAANEPAQHRIAEDPSRAPKPSSAASSDGRPGAAALLLGMLAAFVLGGILMAKLQATPTQVTFLDVGKGTAILIEASGARILVDGGPPGKATLLALDRHLLPWQRSLNLVVMTDLSDAHIGGLPEVLTHYRVDALLDTAGGAPSTRALSPDLRALEAALRSGSIRRLPSEPQTSLRMGTVQLTVLRAPPGAGSKPPDPATVLLTAGARSAVLLGDRRGILNADARNLMPAQAESFQNPPRIAILEPNAALRGSAGVSLAPASGGQLRYSTSENGDITLSFGGNAIRIRVSRGPKRGIGSGR